MAHKGGWQSSRNGRDSQGQRRGCKGFRQRNRARRKCWYVNSAHAFTREGTLEWAAIFTLFALIDGTVRYERKDKERKRVVVLPAQ